MLGPRGGQHRHKSLAECPFCEQATKQIGNSKGHIEGIGQGTGPEHGGDEQLARRGGIGGGGGEGGRLVEFGRGAVEQYAVRVAGGGLQAVEIDARGVAALGAGGNRRALEALAARADYRRFELNAARLALAGNMATAAITRARLAAQLEATTAILRVQDEQLRLAHERVRIGQASPDEALSLQAQAEQTRAELPALRKQLQQTEHLLAVLAGRAPGTGGIPAFTLADFTLPVEMPLVVPSELVRRRPDIQASEALLHAANADYGVAVAKLYPQINLSANLGSQALTTGALFGGGSAVWGLVAQLTQPLFNPGLPAEKRAALAAFDAAVANYQSVVLESLRNVADTLRAVESDAQTLTALAAADMAAQASLQSVERQYRLGAASYLQLLIAQQQAQSIRINMVAVQAQRLVDSVALYQALGGGVS